LAKKQNLQISLVADPYRKENDYYPKKRKMKIFFLRANQPAANAAMDVSSFHLIPYVLSEQSCALLCSIRTAALLCFLLLYQVFLPVKSPESRFGSLPNPLTFRAVRRIIRAI